MTPLLIFEFLEVSPFLSNFKEMFKVCGFHAAIPWSNSEVAWPVGHFDLQASGWVCHRVWEKLSTMDQKCMRIQKFLLFKAKSKGIQTERLS